MRGAFTWLNAVPTTWLVGCGAYSLQPGLPGGMRCLQPAAWCACLDAVPTAWLVECGASRCACLDAVPTAYSLVYLVECGAYSLVK